MALPSFQHRPHLASNNMETQYHKDNARKQQINPVVASHSLSSRHPHGMDRRMQTSTLLSSSGDSPVLSPNTSHQVKNNPINSITRRHTGTVEKLLHSYGFIDSDVQKDGHLFFHYSEVVSDVNNLVTGDCVEFNLSYDYRSNRWLAISVTKLETALTVSKEQFSGIVFKKAEPQENYKNCLDRSGKISYEQSGETFFIPYSTLDLDGENVKEEEMPKLQERVTFCIATDKKTGHMWATVVKKLQPPAMSQGVVCSLKENYGFIERADMVKEVFFHYSEYAANIAELVLGDDVQFNIQHRNNKEVATNISKLPEGTVIFEDVSMEKRRGRITKVIKATRKHAEPLAGSICYETADEGVKKEIAYSERDISGEFTLFVGDVVDFQIAKDRRDGLIHATHVTLCEESFVVSKEKRDKGVVSSVKESYGFLQILSADCGTGVGDAQLFFHFNELYESTNTPVVVGDEIEFTIAYDPGNKSKPIAIRIRKLPKGSIRQDQVVSPHTYNGTVIQDHPAAKSKKGGSPSNDTGLIQYTNISKETVTICYMVKDADLRYGDKVSFNVCEMRRCNDPTAKKAINIKLLSRLGLQTGFVCSLKDSYGFIETVAVDDEIFFHYSCYLGDVNEIHVGDVVEYNLASRNKKISAENVRRAPKDKLTVNIDVKILTGHVKRMIANTSAGDKSGYSGLIAVESSSPDKTAADVYPFGYISLCNKRAPPVVGSQVEFQVAKVTNSIERAANVLLVKDLVVGRVDNLKGTYGFIEVDDKEKKVYFSISDVQDGSTLHAGDCVQFVIVPLMDGTNRVSAVCLRKLKSSPTTDSPVSARPERLISKLKTQMSMTEGPKLVVIRQPLRPDGQTKGFSPRVPRQSTGKCEAVA